MSDEDDSLTLHDAIENHTPLDKILALIQSGTDLDALDIFGRTAMMRVAWNGDEHSEVMIRMLIDAGAEIDGIGYGSSVLVLAAELSHQECIDTLLVAKANADRHTSKSWTAAVSRRITGNRMP